MVPPRTIMHCTSIHDPKHGMFPNGRALRSLPFWASALSPSFLPCGVGSVAEPAGLPVEARRCNIRVAFWLCKSYVMKNMAEPRCQSALIVQVGITSVCPKTCDFRIEVEITPKMPLRRAIGPVRINAYT